jgi:hypothetical protein
MQHSAMNSFPIYFAVLWLGISTLLGWVSGWYSLMQHYPNREDPALFTLRAQSGSMGSGVQMRRILNLSACHGGLRIGILRIFGLMSKDFFVPWEVITITRRKNYFQLLAELNFGTPSKGRLVIPAHVANQLAHAVPDYWPERESV